MFTALGVIDAFKTFPEAVTKGGQITMQNGATSRMPSIKEVKTPEEILPALRTIVRRARQRQMNEALDLQAGEKVVMVTDSTIDPLLTDALAEAIREAGGRADLIALEGYPDLTDPVEIVETMFGRNWFPAWVWEAVRQADIFIRLAFMKFPHVPNLPISFRAKNGGKRKPRVIGWELPADILLSDCMTYPLDVWDAIDQKTWELYNGAKHIEITDRDGTNLTFDLTPADWVSRPDLFTPGHLFVPFPQERTLQGVVAFRSLTFGGPVPVTKLAIKGRQVVELEGGGSFGDLLRRSFEEYRNVAYEKLPGPGCNWVSTFAFCTNPKFRRSPIYSTARGSSRVHAWCLGHRRSGFIHGSVGSALAGPNHKLIRHFELMFPTMVADGREVIQDGHLVALDDPGVRGIAERYGNPDELLREDWIPDRETAI